MNLAEALISQENAIFRTTNVKNRIIDNVKISEDDTFSEDVDELMDEFMFNMDFLTMITRNIEYTNSITYIKNDITLSDIIAKKGEIQKKIRMLEKLAATISQNCQKDLQPEVSIINAINERQIHMQIDNLYIELKQYNMIIEKKNLETKLQNHVNT